MGYLLDFAYNTIEDISDTKPVLFQRDGALHIASPQGLAHLPYGLCTAHTAQRAGKQWDEQARNAATDVISKWKETDYDKQPLFKKKEEPYLRAIAFGPDDSSFTLDDIAKTAQALTALGDDGNIRMINHLEYYHSHKYGYAADGIDVRIEQAKVMSRATYLDLLRKKEESIIEALEQLAKRGETNHYPQPPTCVIITPYTQTSFPTGGTLEREEKPWSKNTKLWAKDSTGSIIYQNQPNKYTASPHRIETKINTQRINAKKAEEFKQQNEEQAMKLNKELAALQRHLPLLEAPIARLNDSHNQRFKELISQTK
ncbi:hypothetical protein JXA12_00800 [Candidatus Woesearchaeota archaeon]|nr:hypothetical protein [Candidatus Woesearchaeota archaeon]